MTLRIRPTKVNLIILLYLLVAVIATVQAYFGSAKSFGQIGRLYTGYNNYVIFKNSFFHLIQGKDLYIAFPDEEWDLYKYSPTFAFIIGIISYLPDFFGLLIWNLLNTIPLLMGILQLKQISDEKKIYILLFCSVELLGSLQNSQSNGITAALLILTFTSLENMRYIMATFLVVISVYLKIYGGIAFVLFLFYPGKYKSALYSMGWFLILGCLPLLVISFNQLLFLYKSWGTLLKVDQANSIGISVAGILQSWFGADISKNMITLAGLILLLLPFVQIHKYRRYGFRLLMLCYILIWAVIFNHKAESPTYIIAISGIGIWFFSRRATIINIILIVLAFIFTSLSSGDLFPRFVRESFIKPYDIKALFSIIIFGRILFELFSEKFDQETNPVRVAKDIGDEFAISRQ
jgi:hypothetical protein